MPGLTGEEIKFNVKKKLPRFKLNSLISLRKIILFPLAI